MAQNNNVDSVYILDYNKELIKLKKGEKLYFFSEIHVDNLSYMFTENSLNDVKDKSELLYFSLYKHLYDSCMVRSFIFEAPISYEYFFSNFVKTGDTSWLAIIDGYATVKSQIYALRKLYLENKYITIYCVDREYKHTIQTFIDAMFYLVLYEPYKVAPMIGISIDTDENFYYFDSLFQDTRIIPPLYHQTVELIANLKYMPKKKNAKLLYNELSKIDADTAGQGIYGNLMKQNYDYFLRLKHSYIRFYKNKNKTLGDFKERENFILKNIEEILSKDTINSFYCLFGYEHLLSVKPSYTPLYVSLIADLTYKNQIASGLIYYEQFKYMYPEDIYLFMDQTMNKSQDVDIHNDNSKLPNYIILVR